MGLHGIVDDCPVWMEGSDEWSREGWTQRGAHSLHSSFIFHQSEPDAQSTCSCCVLARVSSHWFPLTPSFQEFGPMI